MRGFFAALRMTDQLVSVGYSGKMKVLRVGSLFMAAFFLLCCSRLMVAQVRQPVVALAAEAVVNLPNAPMVQAAGETGAAASGAGQTSSSQDGAAAAAGGAQGAGAGTGGAAASNTTSPEDAKQKQHDEAERELKVQEKQRLLGVMPQFQVVMGGTAVPLTPGEKMRLALHSAIDPFYIAYAFVVGGGYGELVDSHPGFGWGPPGYFKRVGASYADNVNGAIIGNALLPIVLHQDPRYFRKGSGSVMSRFLFAAEATVVCHGDNGKNQANVSNVLGNFISGAISNAYYPANERGVGLTLENGAEVTAFGAVGGQILEFGPDLARLLHRKKNRVPVVAPAAPAAGSAASPGGATRTQPL
jgi:hypothetical protein